MVSGRCSARPAELVAYARETDDVVALLRSQLLEFEARVQWLLLRSLARIGGDPTWETTRQLDDLASWVAGRTVVDPYRVLDGGAIVAAGLDYFTLGAPPMRSATR